eukprot:TRINITY_DN70451_c0_g1_i1.p2 TRINITY_DN70451_c0_g1~~TRINITY_DN70451_c0_g1_i1.p2  ORF type:complete len:290 (+),score=66.01 TRINITY_DN70451_c0_g1_i1:74-943(+)
MREGLPEDVIDTVGAYYCVSWREWLRWRGVMRRYYEVEWYISLGARDIAIVPSPQARSIPAALAQVHGQDGLVIILPGVYREPVRVAKDVTIVGWSPRRDGCVIESLRWEPCVVFAGLGRSLVAQLERDSGSKEQIEKAAAVERLTGTGEKAALRNLTLRTRNPQQSCAIRIVRGAPSVSDCDIDGTVWVSGETTDPLFARCAVRSRYEVGIRVTDHARGRFRSNSISSCSGVRAIRVDRGASPEVTDTRMDGRAEGPAAHTSSVDEDDAPDDAEDLEWLTAHAWDTDG